MDIGAAALPSGRLRLYNGFVTSVDVAQTSLTLGAAQRDRDASEIERAAGAVHYVIANSAPGKLGHIKLNKILWYADLDYFRKHGRSITGLQHYLRAPHGPWSRTIVRAVRWLVRQGLVIERSVGAAAELRREFVSLKPPDMTALTVQQTNILQRMMQVVLPLTARELLNMTNADPLWQETELNEPMLISTGSIVTRSPATAEVIPLHLATDPEGRRRPSARRA